MANRRIHRHLIGAYVYALTVDGIVRYIGKGTGYRVIDHFARAKAITLGKPAYGYNLMPVHTKLAAAMAEDAKVDYIIISNGLSDDEAYDLEKTQITEYPKGQLWNAQPGGRRHGGARLKDVWDNPESRKKLAASIKKGKRQQLYRDRARRKTTEKWADESYREKWLASHRAQWDDPIIAAQRREALREKWATKDEAKEKVRAAVTKAWTPERRAAMAANRRAAWADPEFKARVTARVKTTKSIAKERKTDADGQSSLSLLLDSPRT